MEDFKDIILDGLTSLFEQGNFDELDIILQDYQKNPSLVIKKSPSELKLSDTQRSSTLKITEIISFVHCGFKNIPLENLILPTLLSCIELSLWRKKTQVNGIIKERFFDYPVYSLPLFIDFYLNTSGFPANQSGEIERINYSIKKLLYSKYKDLSLEAEDIMRVSEREFNIYEKGGQEYWFGITSFILSRENEIVNTLKGG